MGLGTGDVVTGPLSERPDPGNEGRLYLANDEDAVTLYYDNGTTWQAAAVVMNVTGIETMRRLLEQILVQLADTHKAILATRT